MNPLPRWDIFCRVIDNYGDIGVAWRLARQLHAEHALAVRLWVDDLAAFARLWSAVSPGVDAQVCEGVDVRAWRETFSATEAADVVIEAFGCALPESYLATMAARAVAPVWLNLEYLTAEPWAGAHHGLPSPHPSLPLTKHFFFPGYRADTGGLLRERGLPDAASDWRARARADYWRGRGFDADALHVSLFAYDNPALPALLDVWASSARAVVVHVPDGLLVPRVAAWAGLTTLASGAALRRGALNLRVVPFMRQDAYDEFLWACDVNFVRGEDSCVRAQWAGQPFVWQAYPQDDDAHRDKLCALFELMSEAMPDAVRGALHDLWIAWNGFAEPARAASAWQALDLDDWRRHALDWSRRLAQQPDLASRLVDFACAARGVGEAGERA